MLYSIYLIDAIQSLVAVFPEILLSFARTAYLMDGKHWRTLNYKEE